jgi:hypothetical protein
LGDPHPWSHARVEVLTDRGLEIVEHFRVKEITEDARDE